MKRELKRVSYLIAISGMLLGQPLSARAVNRLPEQPTQVNANAETPVVTLDLKNATIKQLFDAIHKQTGMDFLYNNEQLASFPRVSVKANQESVESVLRKAFTNSGFTFKVEGKMVTITKKGASNNQKLQKLVGTVTDKDNYPVIGAAVVVKGTHRGVATDMNGKYEIEVRPGETLTFSFIGMEPVDIQYNGARQMDLVLQESSKLKLDEVVVTGIFKKAKESYTGSVATVTEEQLDMYRGQNLLQTLKNIDASINFQIDNLNGSNPNNLPSINIRGNASIPTDLQEFNESQKNTVNTPLIIMDGFEITLEKLMDYNDDEIESINILKDAAATAIYGSRGANGVIVVITKEPEAGKLRVNAEVGLTFEVPDISSYHLLNASDKLALEKAVGLYTDSDGNPADQLTLDNRYNRILKKVLSGTDTDWLSKPLHTGVGQRYNLRLEGGSEEFRWSASAAYTNTQGAMKDSERRNFSGAITLMYRVKNLIFRNYTSVGINRSRESKYGTFSEYAKLQPYESPYDENGNLVKLWSDYNDQGNPLYDASLASFDKSDYQSVTNNFSIEWHPFDGMIVRGQLGLSSTQNGSDKFVSPYDSQFNTKTYKTEDGMLRKGTYDYGTGKDYSYDANLTASYSKTLNEKHQLYFGLDLSASQSRSKMYYFSMEGFGAETVNDLTSAQQYAESTRPTGSFSFYRRMGVTGNANYTYDNRYYVDLSYRVDGNSNFGSDKKYAPFWSAGIGWSLHNEKWLKGNEVINNLRLKLSYGQTGTQLTSSTGSTTVYEYQQGQKYMGWSGAVMQGLGNSKLTWQTTDEFNVGLEFGLWNNRIKGTVDFYTKKTKDLLSYMDMPLSMGFSSYLANVGAVKNIGFESSLSAYIIRDAKHHFNWMLSGQLMYNKNEITELSADIQAQNEKYLNSSSNVEISNLLQVGRPQNAIYGVRSLGIDPSTGNELYLDKDGNVTDTWKISNSVYLGQKDPKYRGILSSMLSWKGFTFNLSFAFHWGGQMYNSTLRDRVEVTSTVIKNQNVDERVLTSRWLQVGDVAAFKKVSAITSKATSRFVMDDNVLELQSVGLQYRWDSEWLKNKAQLESVIFGVNMSDLFYWSSVKVERGLSYPFARNIQASVKLMF